MNESWRQAEADAHEAKAEALAIAIDVLNGIHDAVEPLAHSQLGATVQTLYREKARHEKAAKLVKTR